MNNWKIWLFALVILMAGYLAQPFVNEFVHYVYPVVLLVIAASIGFCRQRA